MPASIIDIHPHIISSDTRRYPLAPLGGKQSGWSRDRPVTFEQFVAAMDEAGVAKAAIVHASTSYGYDNSYVAGSFVFDLARHGNVFLKVTTNNFRMSRLGKATPETFFSRLVQEFGASRIAWGSNYPASEGTLPGLVAEAREALAALPQSDLEWIFRRTAQALYPALADK